MTEPLTPTHIPHPDPDVTTADDTQVTYYEGSPKLRGEFGFLLLWYVIGLLVMAVPILVRAYSDTHVPWYVILGGLVVGLLCWLVPSLSAKRVFYRVTNYRVDVERGLLGKSYDTLELWHVEDVGLRQSPLDRIFNVGTITVTSHDATSPRLELSSIENPRQLLETLKTRIIAVKRQRGVVKVDQG